MSNFVPSLPTLNERVHGIIKELKRTEIEAENIEVCYISSANGINTSFNFVWPSWDWISSTILKYFLLLANCSGVTPELKFRGFLSSTLSMINWKKRSLPIMGITNANGLYCWPKPSPLHCRIILNVTNTCVPALPNSVGNSFKGNRSWFF